MKKLKPILFKTEQDGITKVLDIILIDPEAEIVEGDLMHRVDNKEIIRCNAITDNWIGQAGTGGVQRNLFVKIICSTNKLHNLPQLSEQSIQYLINHYNESGEMPESVEVEEDMGFTDGRSFMPGDENDPDICRWELLNGDGTIDIITIPEAETPHQAWQGKLIEENKYIVTRGLNQTLLHCNDLEEAKKWQSKEPAYNHSKIYVEITEAKDKLYTEKEVFGLFEEFKKDFEMHRLIQILPYELKEWFNSKKKKL